MTVRTKKRRRYRARKMLRAGLACSIVAIIALVVVLILQIALPKDDVQAIHTLNLPSPTPTTQPTAIPEPTETPEPTATPAPETHDAVSLPVIRKVETNEKKIAITVDDCYQIDNLKRICTLAYQNGGRLTLFPIGQNVVRKDMDKILQGCVFSLGFEVENHTWSHARIFRLPESEMAEEIWKQRRAVCEALGVNYRQRYFRLMGGDGEEDQRTMNYLDQLGYEAIAGWTISGSDASMDQIKAALAPGAIFLFHTTDSDKAKLETFIPYAVQQGYELVTLNELLGKEPNEYSDLSSAESEMPAPRTYNATYSEQKKGDYSWDVVRIQTRLAELGYLDSASKTATKGNPADGVYGESTAQAIRRFQTDMGLEPTGKADVETQRLLLGDAA